MKSAAEQATDYWRNNADLAHITPQGKRFPEVGLFGALQQACRGQVFEFGCGDGRLSPAFAPVDYVGMDINPAALAAARRANPHHRYVGQWEPAETVLAYTVLLHIHDDAIGSVAARMREYPRIVIGEIMGRHWRRPGELPVFNRDRADYEQLFGPVAEVIRVPYPHYRCDLELCVWQQ